jgi:hypothetical protein
MNRRIFIQRFGLLGAGTLISLRTFPFSLLNSGKRIKGRITDGSKGLAGVVVSDGYSVVKTDKRGNYSFDAHEHATSVWVSTPAGYEFIMENNIARHYKILSAQVNTYDFQLKRLSKKDDEHNFIIWADPQVRNKKDVKQMMDTTVPDMQQLLAGFSKEELVHAICVGDIVWDNHELFTDYNRAVALMGVPFFQALGNHDMDYRMGGDETSDVTFKAVYGPTYYSFNRGQAHYVVMENVRYLGTDRNYDGYITPEQLQWLQKDLAEVSKDKLLIINLHIPVHDAVKNKEDFYAVLAGFNNVHIMSGHTHYNQNVIRNGVYEHNHGTVCGAWWTGPICEDGTPRGYGVYKVEGTKLKWYYKPTGKDRTDQLSLYTSEESGQKKLVANVFNWDKEWTVNYFTDDQPMGVLKNEPGYDPLAVTLYKGDQLPKGRTFPEPRLTDHLFSAQIAASVKKVKVVATDRFGEQFSKEIIL